MEEREEVGDGRGEGSSAIGDGRQFAISLTLAVDGTHVCIFESSQLEGLLSMGFSVMVTSLNLCNNDHFCGAHARHG